MRTITPNKLKEILHKHKLWLENKEGGERANLSNTNLSNTNLSNTNLWNANLSNANLSYANLSNTKLWSANLSNTKLWSANLRNANLNNANLNNAILSYANLNNAILSYADLSYAILRNANLSYAILRNANLSYADLSQIRNDFMNKLSLAKNEVLGLYDYLQRGQVDGSCYEGECACFVGTIAKVCGEDYEHLSNGITPQSDSHTETWFLAIRQGDIPQNNQVSAITAEWMREFMDKEGIKYPKYEIVAITN